MDMKWAVITLGLLVPIGRNSDGQAEAGSTASDTADTTGPAGPEPAA